MEKKQNQGAINTRPVGTVVALGVLALVAYQVYSGVALKKVGIGAFSIDFADKSAPSPPEASRNFFIGRWQVQQAFQNQISGGTIGDYQADGTLIQTATVFAGSTGHKELAEGHWEFEKLSKDTFRLTILFSHESPAQGNLRKWVGTFKILDQDHIHNFDDNYIAVRMK